MSSTDSHTASHGKVAATPVPGSELRRRFEREGLLDAVLSGEDAPALDALTVEHVTDDSRKVDWGSTFVAVRGVDADGHSFIDSAIQSGARLVVCEAVSQAVQSEHPHVVFVRVTDSRTAVATMAAALYEDPAESLRLIGVTGTNGKTTVAVLVHHMLELLEGSTGLLSTLKAQTGNEEEDVGLTTPGPLTLHHHLRQMVDGGCGSCAMEVSSHALDQRRVHGLTYDVAVFTNLTPEHLNYHGTLAAYRTAKKRLFDGLGDRATAVYNADDEHGARMVTDTEATAISFAVDQPADVEVHVLDAGVDGLRLRIEGRQREFRLAGRFNAYNVAAAYSVGRALGYDPEPVLDALAEAPPVPGRFEPLHFENGTTVIVDYAHTPDALSTILRAVRDTAPDDATLWCVFGCGGDRDVTKRPKMGGIAEREADRVIVTSDNPRTEAPENILDDIREGVEHPDEMKWLVDREAAIRTAADKVAPGDVVVIAGKGHETTQTIGTETRPFDDRKIAQRYFSR